MVCSLLPSWPQGSAVLRELRMWLMRWGRRKGRYGPAPPLLSGWAGHPSQAGIQLVPTCCSLGTLSNPCLGGLCLCDLHHCKGSQIVRALLIYCGSGGQWVCYYTLCSFVFSCVFAGWGKQEIHSSGTNSLRIGQLFSLMMQWDDVIFNGMTKRSNPTLCTGLTFVGTMHCRWWLFRCSADLISPADGYSCSTGWKMPVSFQGTSLLCSAAICAPWHGRLRLFALYSSFYFQTQNCLQLAETKTVISVQKPFWVKKCLLWFMINSEL